MTRPLTPEETRRLVVQRLKLGREYTTGDIAFLTGLSQNRAVAATSALVKMGVLKFDTVSHSQIRVYRLNP